MSPEAIYTTVVFSLSIGFFGATLILASFMPDTKGRILLPLFALLSVLIALIVETSGWGIPRFGFAPVQIVTIPVGSVLALLLFFYIVHRYTKSHTP